MARRKLIPGFRSGSPDSRSRSPGLIPLDRDTPEGGPSDQRDFSQPAPYPTSAEPPRDFDVTYKNRYVKHLQNRIKLLEDKVDELKSFIGNLPKD